MTISDLYITFTLQETASVSHSAQEWKTSLQSVHHNTGVTTSTLSNDDGTDNWNKANTTTPAQPQISAAEQQELLKVSRLTQYLIFEKMYLLLSLRFMIKSSDC